MTSKMILQGCCLVNVQWKEPKQCHTLPGLCVYLASSGRKFPLYLKVDWMKRASVH